MNPRPEEVIVIALGGSITFRDTIQVQFLKRFRKFILNFLKEGKKIVIIIGGGKITRDYQNAASEIIRVSDEEKDWIGIHATRINAQLLRAIFFDVAHPVVLDNPHKKIKNEKKYNLFIASGWKPGWSTDYIAVMLARRFGAKKFICATSVPYVYNDDVEKNADAKPIPEISWSSYRKIAGDVWTPGMRVPVDPIAAKLAQRLKLEVIVALGTDLKNLENILRGKKFIGTVIK